MEKNTLLEKVELFATDILKNQLSSDLIFHNFEHTEKLVEAVKSIGTQEQLSEEEMEIAQIVAWFQNTGFRESYAQHGKESKAIASAFLTEEKVAEETKDKILDFIYSSELRPKPEENIEKVLLDAQKAVIIGSDFKTLLNKQKEESLAQKKEKPSDIESFQNYLDTILKYDFYTKHGKEVLLPARDKFKAKLEKRINKIQKAVDESLSIDLGVSAAQLKAMKKKLQKAQGRPERGIETMFRLTSKNHLDLSGMADSKANIMISINSIIMSVVMGSLMSKLDSNEHLIWPTILLLGVNLASLIFAILSLRPNVSDGLFTREDIENQRTNLLFFGNFHKMKREDYHWGMNKLMENANFLYSNLIDDIYFLGVVLARKYKLLRTSYTIFMFGMVIVVIAYIISLTFIEEPIKDAIINTLQE